jgi:hypothetical protein
VNALVAVGWFQASQVYKILVDPAEISPLGMAAARATGQRGHKIEGEIAGCDRDKGRLSAKIHGCYVVSQMSL